MGLNDWKKHGSIAIWKYEPFQKNFPGWHMTCDELGYDSLIELLTYLSKSSVGSKRTLVLDVPDKWSASSSLKKTAELKATLLLYSEADDWALKTEKDRLLISVGRNKIVGLCKSIEKAKGGEYDFSFGGKKGQNLWFW